MVAPSIPHHPITMASIKGAIPLFALGMIVSMSMLVLEYLWIIASSYILNTTLPALERKLFIVVTSIVKAFLQSKVLERFSKCYDYKQFNIIRIIVGYLFGSLIWFTLDVYNLNPVLTLFGLEFKSSELMVWLTFWSVVDSLMFLMILTCAIVQKAQENGDDQDSFVYTLMMV